RERAAAPRRDGWPSGHPCWRLRRSSNTWRNPGRKQARPTAPGTLRAWLVEVSLHSQVKNSECVREEDAHHGQAENQRAHGQPFHAGNFELEVHEIADDESGLRSEEHTSELQSREN